MKHTNYYYKSERKDRRNGWTLHTLTHDDGNIIAHIDEAFFHMARRGWAGYDPAFDAWAIVDDADAWFRVVKGTCRKHGISATATQMTD